MLDDLAPDTDMDVPTGCTDRGGREVTATIDVSTTIDVSATASPCCYTARPPEPAPR